MSIISVRDWSHYSESEGCRGSLRQSWDKRGSWADNYMRCSLPGAQPPLGCWYSYLNNLERRCFENTDAPCVLSLLHFGQLMTSQELLLTSDGSKWKRKTFACLLWEAEDTAQNFFWVPLWCGEQDTVQGRSEAIETKCLAKSTADGNDSVPQICQRISSSTSKDQNTERFFPYSPARFSLYLPVYHIHFISELE